MTDKYLNFAQSAFGKRICRTLGLPVPSIIQRVKQHPEQLVKNVLYTRGDTLVESTIAELNAECQTIEKAIQASLQDTQVVTPDEVPANFHGIVFNACGVASASELEAVYQFFHQHLKQLATSGKVVIVAMESKYCANTMHASIQRGLLGFVKALAKEVGRKGITINLLYANTEAGYALASPLRFLLSYRSAYVNGQSITVDNKSNGSQKSEPVSQQAYDKCWSKPLANKIALVTGASRGIGLSIAETLARDGATVIGLDIPQAEYELKTAMLEIGGESLLLNITEHDAPERIAKRVEQQFGAIDILVHNAGITRDKLLVNMPEAHWRQVIDVNLTSIARINQCLMARSHINRGGRIVCVSSISGIAGNVGQTNYAVSKAALIGMIEHISTLLAEQHITINAVAPGFIETQMTDEIPLLTRFVGRRMSALSQGGLPVDVAETISFLAAPQSYGVSANLIRVCGLNMMGA